MKPNPLCTTYPRPQGLTVTTGDQLVQSFDLSPPAGVNLWRHLAEIYSEK
ncbi:hypothetical protein RJR13_004667 [Salmonella enterica]|nr:hypothetical protein [Salmonella enterica]